MSQQLCGQNNFTNITISNYIKSFSNIQKVEIYIENTLKFKKPKKWLEEKKMFLIKLIGMALVNKIT